MQHHATAPQPGTWQEMAGRLAGLVAWHVAELCRAHGISSDQQDDIAGEALASLCVSVRSAWARGVRAVNPRYFAMTGLTAVLHTRRCRPLQALDRPEGLADRAPGPDAEAEADELLDALLARLPDGRMRQAVAMKAAGLSTAEAAAALGVCRQRVEQLLGRARAVLLAR
jgi:DNA-directed RNA polymerase specialized sigma24 family protein